jgi:AraC-like DNA-binding protein
VDPRIARALADIHTQLARLPSLAVLARAANLSVSRFSHLFRQEVGTSPVRYIYALRMVRAQLLLERTPLSIKEVMAQVGCNDPSHFARDFRAFHGLSPRDWRVEAARRSLRGEHENGDALASASVARIAVLANERRKRPTKPPPRARAPDPALQLAVVNITFIKGACR